MRRVSRWLAVSLLCLPAAAGADGVDRKLASYENEARQLGTNLPEPNVVPQAAGQRRLVDAEVAFALGDYDTAALMLYDLSSRPGPDQLTALYYLGESMYQKGDKGAAAAYFEQIARSPSVTSRYYQPSLLRLIEIAIAQEGDRASDEHLKRLDAIPVGSRLPEVAYVRGKLAHARGNYDEAIQLFSEVPKGSPREYQATYYTATSLVAKKDLARATEVLTELVSRKPKSTGDRRVIELGNLALGRLYYERDQPSKSIDAYLQIDRRSDLFPDALYEVAWVYVKGKQYDKALRALELLHLSDPTSQKTPTVRILEGNLRIRKAQLIRQKQIAGTIEKDEPSDPSAEYERAAQIFTETHDMYLPSYQALSRMVDAPGDPARYLAQIAGRTPAIFQATAPIPEAAAAYLRDVPAVQRAVAIVTDRAEIEASLAQSEAVIARLEGVLAAGDPTAVYPALQSRRARIGQIQDDLAALRGDLAEQQVKLLGGGAGGLAGLTAARRGLAQGAAAPNAEQAHADRVAAAQQQYDAIDQATGEVSAAIGATQAVAVALRKYAIDADPALPPEQQTAIAETLDTSAREAAAIEAELAAVQRELVLGRDLAGIGDAGLAKARAARRQLAAALDAEHRALAAAAGGSRDKGKSQKLAALGERALRLSESLAQIEQRIDGLVGRGIEQARLAIAAERSEVAKLSKELAEDEALAREIGGSVLAASFRDVKARFYDIVIRTDVGNVDVSWSLKEDADDDLKRLNLSRQRDLKQLRDEFKGILEDSGAAPPKPAPDAGASGAAGGGSTGGGSTGGGSTGGGGTGGGADPSAAPAPAGSPDKGGAGARVKPGSDAAPAPTPTVRPDNEQARPAPKGGAAPKAGTR